jgi:hypothetical protein
MLPLCLGEQLIIYGICNDAARVTLHLLAAVMDLMGFITVDVGIDHFQSIHGIERCNTNLRPSVSTEPVKTYFATWFQSNY